MKAIICMLQISPALFGIAYTAVIIYMLRIKGVNQSSAAQTFYYLKKCKKTMRFFFFSVYAICLAAGVICEPY